MMMEVVEDAVRCTAQFISENGEVQGSPFDIPLDITFDNLTTLCNKLLDQDEEVPLAFYVDEKEIKSTLKETLEEGPIKTHINTEKTTYILYQPQALFKVRAITRCTSSLPGHTKEVISACFSPDGQQLASGSGDTTVRFWDLNTETPEFTCEGHKNWVLAIAWSPLGNKLASACKNGIILIWDPKTGKQIGKPLIGHQKFVTALVWEPLHLHGESRHLASSSKDTNIKIWDVVLGQCIKNLSGHTMSVTCLRWGGSGLIYSGSQDRTLKVWRPSDGSLVRTLTGHAHWINTMALSTDYVLKTSFFEPADAEKYNKEINKEVSDLQQKALERFKKFRESNQEYLVSGSDDFTMRLWTPELNDQLVGRFIGHKQLINDVKFSPDGRLVASASFDKSIKIWTTKNLKFIATLRGHVQPVYQIAWSADSRLLVSGSADSTLKLWNIRTSKLEIDLPGHADEVYVVDWSADGQRVVSGGKDKVLRIWRK